MIDISVKGVRKAFLQDKEILRGLSFEINEGVRVGLLGKIGAGKTTLFRILTGELEADSGDVVIGSGKRLGVMNQIPHFPPEYLAEDVLKSAHRHLYALQEKMDALQPKLAQGREEDILAFDRLQSAFEAGGGYEMDYTRSKVANGLAIPPDMLNRPFSKLSGGEKTRVNLARLILEETDILLLDEPTNHLDLNATEWLEDYLQRFKGTVLTISHDRWFLDKCVKRIIELTDGVAEEYSGNYSFFVTEKQRRYEEARKAWEKSQKQISQLQKAADDLHLWAFMGNDKLHKRAFSMEKRIQRLQQVEKPKTERRMKARFGEKEFRGDEALVIHGLEKSFGQRRLFSDLEFLVQGGERIALLGDNGSGKSTLLNILMGREPADGGLCRFGPAIKPAYLEQQVRFDNMDRTLVDTMLYEGGCTPQEARDRLGAFGFSGEDAFKLVRELSGGELSRLRLCILMKDEMNFLILDEPTNHLDILSREWIEDALEDYGETLLMVSHDRYFISRFATRIWELEGGVITDWRCSFEEYRERKARAQQVSQAAAKKEHARKEKPKRGPSPEKKLAALEKEITRWEEKIRLLDEEIEANATDYEALSRLFEEKNTAEAELEAVYGEWCRLTDEA